MFGGPRWRDLVGADRADGYVRSGAVPLLLDAQDVPIRRNFVHVEDLVSAILIALEHPGAHQQTFNIAMDEPVDYGELAAYLARTRGLEAVPIRTEYVSNWLDNRKARMLLGWRPEYDMERMVESAWAYQRAGRRPAHDLVPRLTLARVRAGALTDPRQAGLGGPRQAGLGGPRQAGLGGPRQAGLGAPGRPGSAPQAGRARRPRQARARATHERHLRWSTTQGSGMHGRDVRQALSTYVLPGIHP